MATYRMKVASLTKLGDSNCILSYNFFVENDNLVSYKLENTNMFLLVAPEIQAK